MSVHQTFEKMALAQPGSIALRFDTSQLTYQQLNQHANCQARRLRAANVGHGDVVALLLPRSIEMIVAMLAVLKAGAAYLPIDQNNPPSHTQACLDQCSVKVIISNDQPISLSLDENNLAAADNLDLPIEPDDKAYLMFTSGSTGQPKGVMVPHRAIHRLVVNTNYIDISPFDNILQLSPTSFDASTFEIWGALLNGATLVLYPSPVLDPNLLAKVLRHNEVTILWLTAALFHLIGQRKTAILQPVKTLLSGGDVLHAKVINQVLDTIPGITIINGYGPTENTTFTCCHRMTTANRPDTTVPIGMPVNGSDIHIVDEYLKPVAPGTTGELLTSGAGVALGYINAEQPNCFFYDHRIAATLIYRSGDFVRQNAHGELEFIGRKDNQVKVRGFRISLEEVQSHLLALAGVSDAAVTLVTDESGEQVLTAYLQVLEPSTITIDQLKQSLSWQIPGYLIPDKLLFCRHLPINKNGKIDKTTLLNGGKQNAN